MKKKQHIISGVVPGSIAEEMEIEPGDILLEINGMEIEDILDYRFYAEEENVTLVIRKPDGEEWELEIEKEYGEDIGLDFENGLMDEY
ncbi:MAG: PDZ domain-containing protein, partial [Anaerovoracaceae bacterium]